MLLARFFDGGSFGGAWGSDGFEPLRVYCQNGLAEGDAAVVDGDGFVDEEFGAGGEAVSDEVQQERVLKHAAGKSHAREVLLVEESLRERGEPLGKRRVEAAGDR